MDDQVEQYLSELAMALQRRGADAQATSDAVAEVSSRVQDDGQEPRSLFGSPEEHAERVMASRERSTEVDWDWRTFRATGFDEMDLLADAGRQGWELMDVGVYALHCRRPRTRAQATQWEYRRRIGLERRGILETMTALGWEPCGLFGPLQYFKRNLKTPAQIPN